MTQYDYAVFTPRKGRCKLMGNVYKLDRNRQAAPQLYERLRTMIITLDYEPGTVLSRAKISALFQVSQTPVREALLRLSEEGLIDVYPQAATRVSLIDVGHAEEALFLRRAVELELVREAALCQDAAKIAALQTLIDKQTQYCANRDYPAFMQADHEFHYQMSVITGRNNLYTLVHSRCGHIDRLRRLHLPTDNKMGRIINEHTLILAAIQAGDPQAAQDHLRTHLSKTLSYTAQIQQSHPHYFDPSPAL